MPNRSGSRSDSTSDRRGAQGRPAGPPQGVCFPRPSGAPRDEDRGRWPCAVAALGPGKLHQLLGQAGQAFQRGLDFGGTCGTGRISGFGVQPLRLRDGAGKRGAQLMGGIGGKAALGLESGRQTRRALRSAWWPGAESRQANRPRQPGTDPAPRAAKRRAAQRGEAQPAGPDRSPRSVSGIISSSGSKHPQLHSRAMRGDGSAVRPRQSPTVPRNAASR